MHRLSSQDRRSAHLQQPLFRQTLAQERLPVESNEHQQDSQAAGERLALPMRDVGRPEGLQVGAAEIQVTEETVHVEAEEVQVAEEEVQVKAGQLTGKNGQ